jgi:hypothetical protein
LTAAAKRSRREYAMNEALSNLFDDACDRVSVDGGGRIIYQSVFQREWEEAGGDFEHLLALVEDHLYEDDDNDGDESIDWNAVEKEYREFQAKQNTEQEEECKNQDSNQLTLPN